MATRSGGLRAIGRQILPAGLFVLCLALVACSRGLPAEFDGLRWRNADLETRVRTPMADALVRAGVLHGMDRRAVIRLLGEPSPKPSYRFPETELAYVLGPARNVVGIDRDWLLIQLDATGHVAGYRVISDEASRFR